MNINKTSADGKYSLKTVNKFKPISYLSKDSEDKYKANKSGFDIIYVDVPVKNLYINDYDIYDISGLLKKSSREDADYTANFSSSKIVYNFKDLKKTDICKYDEKQIFEISNTCQPLAGAMGDGNNWTIKFDSDGKKLIKIELNPENEKSHVTYLLKCSKIKNYAINEEKSSYKSYNDSTDIELYIETAYACPTYGYFILLEWIEYFRYLLGVIFIVLGIVVIFPPSASIGVIVVLCLIFVFSIVSFIKIFFPPSMRFWKIWLILISCIIFSGILSLTIVSNEIKGFYLKYIIGAYLGFALGQYFYDFLIEVIIWNSLFFYLLLISLFIIGGVVLSHFSAYFTIYLNSSFLGVYIFIRGISFFAGHFPSEYIMVLLKTNGEVGQIGKIINLRFYVYNSVILGLGGIVFLFQLKERRFDWAFHDLDKWFEK